MSILLSESLAQEICNEIHKQADEFKSGQYELDLELTPCNANVWIEVITEERKLEQFEMQGRITDTYSHKTILVNDIEFYDDNCDKIEMLYIDDFITMVNGKM